MEEKPKREWMLSFWGFQTQALRYLRFQGALHYCEVAGELLHCVLPRVFFRVSNLAACSASKVG